MQNLEVAPKLKRKDSPSDTFESISKKFMTNENY